jgi:hypothetical protein
MNGAPTENTFDQAQAIRERVQRSPQAAYEMVLGQQLAPKRGGARTELYGKCPLHKDNNPSWRMKPADRTWYCDPCGKGGDIFELVRRIQNCGFTDAVKSLTNQLSLGEQSGRPPRIAATYDYKNENGELHYQVVRLEPKGFYQRRPDGNGGWINSLDGVQRVLYHLPELLDNQFWPERGVFVCEGEKDVDALTKLELLATTNAGGAGKWSDEYNLALAYYPVSILPDNDESGRKHAIEVASSLLSSGIEVRVLKLPGLPPKGDVSDWLAAGGTKEELLKLAKACKRLTTTEEINQLFADQFDATGKKAEDESDTTKNASEEIDTAADKVRSPQVPAWPRLDPAALYGIAGEFVRLVEPATETDSVALLFQFLAAFGCAAGRNLYAVAESTKHYLNINVLVVGDSSKSRKGSSWARVKRVFELADPDWVGKCTGGLSSGEGLIWAVRDPIIKREKRDGAYQEVESDPGISDKRLLVFESEFALVLKVQGREGNTLSGVIRQAFDSGDLNTLVKNNPARATGAHITIVGHITREELVRYLDATEMANGYGNRLMFCMARRSKCLPFGGNCSDSELDTIRASLSDALAFARTPGEIGFSPDAARLWEEVYPTLSEGRPGLLGALLGRSEALTLRLACLYAVLDQSTEITRDHLKAALAVWEYAEASTAFIFGDRLGDPDADAILAALRASPLGLSRTEISGLFMRNRSANQIQRALEALMRANLAECVIDATGDGRPVERWVARTSTKGAGT